jgi:hypothetical protein
VICPLCSYQSGGRLSSVLSIFFLDLVRQTQRELGLPDSVQCDVAPIEFLIFWVNNWKSTDIVVQIRLFAYSSALDWRSARTARQATGFTKLAIKLVRTRWFIRCDGHLPIRKCFMLALAPLVIVEHPTVALMPTLPLQELP